MLLGVWGAGEEETATQSGSEKTAQGLFWGENIPSRKIKKSHQTAALKPF